MKSNEVIFVGGAPRTGTTLLQALICTSPRSNPYISECSYLTSFMHPYHLALGTWELHTQQYFRDVEDMCMFHGDILRTILSRFRRFLGSPEILTLKDPQLTASFHILNYLMPETKFAVMVRDPRDTILSRLEVMERSSGSKPGLEEIEFACNEYNAAYAGLLKKWQDFGDRLLLISYNSLVSGRDLDTLASLGVNDLRPELLTRSAWITSQQESNPWNTNLYGGQVSTASVGRHENFMEIETAEIVLERCSATVEALSVVAAHTRMHASRFA